MLRLCYFFCGFAFTVLGGFGLLVHSWLLGGTFVAVGLTALWSAVPSNRKAPPPYLEDGSWLEVANLALELLAIFC